MLLDALFDFYKCPNTGNTISALPGDDKALCPCGKPNPKYPNEALAGRMVAHYIFCLIPAPTPEE